MTDQRLDETARRASLARGAWMLLLVVAVGLALALTLRGSRDEEGANVEGRGDTATGMGRVEVEVPAGDLAEATRRSAGPDLGVLYQSWLFEAKGGLPIQAGVRLGGSGRLEGRVLERGSGAGVSGARVTLLTMPPAGSRMLMRVHRMAGLDSTSFRRWLPVATVGSGTGGEFAFRDVRSGTYFVEARSAWHAPDHAVLVRVDGEGAGGPVEPHVRSGGRVLGRVVRPDGRPSPGVRVFLHPGPTSFFAAARAGDLRVLDATTDDGGAFVFFGVAPAKGYEVTAVGPSFAISHATGLEVVAGADTVVEVSTDDGGIVRGKVLARSAGEGTVLEPVAGAHVGILPRGLRDRSFSLEVLEQTRAVTDARGEYVIHHAPIGELDVACAMNGLRPARSTTLRAVEGETVEAEPIVLERGATVTLRFTDGDGAPVSGVHASWAGTDSTSLEFESTFAPILLRVVEGFEVPASDADGRLVAGPFAGDPPFEVFCRAPGHESERVEWSPVLGGAELQVRLSRGGAVEGVVRDAERDEPITRFTIRTSRRLDPSVGAPRGSNPHAGGLLIEDEGGRFHLGGLADRGTPVVFTAPGYLAEKVEIPVTPGETTHGIFVEMRRGGTIHGRVVDDAGRPVAGAQVAAMDELGRSPSGTPRPMHEMAAATIELIWELVAPGPDFVITDRDGAFELTCLPPGAVRVHAWHRGHADARTELLRVGAGDPVDAGELVMTAGGGIFGEVRDRFAQPVPGALVLAFPTELMATTVPSLRWARLSRTDAEGVYRIERLAPGEYSTACTRADGDLDLTRFLGTLAFEPVRVRPEEMVRHDITDPTDR